MPDAKGDVLLRDDGLVVTGDRFDVRTGRVLLEGGVVEVSANSLRLGSGVVETSAGGIRWGDHSLLVTWDLARARAATRDPTAPTIRVTMSRLREQLRCLTWS